MCLMVNYEHICDCITYTVCIMYIHGFNGTLSYGALKCNSLRFQTNHAVQKTNMRTIAIWLGLECGHKYCTHGQHKQCGWLYLQSTCKFSLLNKKALLVWSLAYWCPNFCFTKVSGKSCLNYITCSFGVVFCWIKLIQPLDTKLHFNLWRSDQNKN